MGIAAPVQPLSPVCPPGIAESGGKSVPDRGGAGAPDPPGALRGAGAGAGVGAGQRVTGTSGTETSISVAPVRMSASATSNFRAVSSGEPKCTVTSVPSWS